ncbi:hydrogenase [Geothermobacter hydrogeniphilus]|uniref:Hydrogenase n=2 Tax=Geothermobacter hydrogeniphilus TaxID=1969733 RepID=A0A2K2H9Q5_9BACT|nr:hydrogenase [Geothermobacter hydrogeniphilus]
MMTEQLLQLLPFAVILLGFYVLASQRLRACVEAVALQGALISCYPLLLHGFEGQALMLSGGALLLKGIVIPLMLLRAMRKLQIEREIESLIGFIPTLVVGVVVAAGAFLFADTLPLALEHHHSLVVPTALATMGCGFLLIITRRKALTQVLGYLVLENGIYIFGALISKVLPAMVEAGVLLDLLVAVFIMGIVLHQIKREFSTLDTQPLTELKE